MRGKASPGERRAFILILALAAACVVLFLLKNGREPSRGTVAAIDYDGERVAVLELAEYTDPTVVTMGQLGVDIPVRFELRSHQIRFYQSDCPDKLCEGYGFIGGAMQTAVCMPNRTSVTIL